MLLNRIRPQHNMSEDKSIDLIGVGRLAKAIPATAWKRVVETACSTFEKVVAPITETTSGLGRLIQAKFNKLIDSEKVIVAKTAQEAAETVKNAGMSLNENFNHLILCKIIDHAQSQADPGIRKLWSNLLAREMTEGAVHPEIAEVLSRLTTKDALLLFEIARKEKGSGSTLLKSVGQLTASFSLLGLTISFRSTKSTLSHVILERLDLVRNSDLGWRLSAFGLAVLEAVTPIDITQGSKEA
jgi:hypothetical protein